MKATLDNYVCAYSAGSLEAGGQMERGKCDPGGSATGAGSAWVWIVKPRDLWS